MDAPFHFDYNAQHTINGSAPQQHRQSYAFSENRQYDGFDLPLQVRHVQVSSAASIDVDEINRIVGEKTLAPYAAGVHRPHSSEQAWHASSFPGAPGPFTEPYHGGPFRHDASGHSSVTASDSAYQSIPITSGGPRLPIFHAPNLQREYSQLTASSGEGQAPYDDGQRSVISEPVETGDRCGSSKVIRTRAKSFIPPCHCGKQLKNNSDAFKHRLQHTKPFLCPEPGCSRNREGFATKNDLERHRSSVHRQLPVVGRKHGYICVLCPQGQVGSKPKFWPRRDNFKAHIKRKHNQSDPERVMDASSTQRPDDAMTVESGYGSAPSHIDPMDRSLQQDLSSPLVPSFANHTGGDTFFDFGNTTQSNQLAGVGVGAGSSNSLLDANREPDLGMYASGSDSRLSVLSTAASRIDSLCSPADSVMPTPGQATGHVPHVRVSHHGSETSPQTNFDNMQWSPGYDGSRDGPGGASGEAGNEVEGHFPCPSCDKVKKRECDLRKHMKRHNRPYGCTFPDCSKRFGSRNDWKRHESTQHFLQEMWRCNFPGHDGYKCGELVHTSNCLQRHFQAKHPSISHQEYDGLCHRMHLGINAFHRFWCGFCNDMIEPSDDYMQNALDFRYKHIGDHYDKFNAHIDNWICVRTNKRKGDLTEDDRKKIRDWMRTGRSDGGAYGVAEEGGGMPGHSSLVHGLTEPAICTLPVYDPGMAVQSALNTSKNKRRCVTLDLEPDADGVSDDDWRME